MVELDLGHTISSLASHKSFLEESQDFFRHDAYSKSVKVRQAIRDEIHQCL